MSLRFAALGAALATFVAHPALALKITLEPPQPAPIGTPHTFRVATVEDAVGDVTFRWNFGDGATTDFVPEKEATHTYQDVGHYTIIVLASDAMTSTSATLTETAHHPLTKAAPRHSSSIIAVPENHQVWNVNPDSDSISVIDEMTLDPRSRGRSRPRAPCTGRRPRWDHLGREPDVR